jgi:hypothetical protein
MFGSVILEVAIGLVMIYLVMALLCSGVTEWIARIFALRSKTLKDGISKLINDDQGLYKKITDHPLFTGLNPKKPKEHSWDKRKIYNWEIIKKKTFGPSEVPPATFAQIILDTLIDSKDISTNNKKSINNLLKSIETLAVDDKNKKVFKSLLISAKTKATNLEGTLKEFQTSLEKWFDDSMQRVTGWYKRKTQVIVLCLALVICFGINADTFGIANSLYTDPALRSAVVAAAEATVNESASHNLTMPNYAQISENMSAIDLHLGWDAKVGDRNKSPNGFWGWLTKVFGILITVFAVTMGAPFWFDLLGKLVNLRSSGKMPQKKEEETTPAK